MALETKKNLVGGLAGVPASQLKERKREDAAWKNKLFGYLEGFKKSFESLTSGKKVKGEGLFSKMFSGLKGLFSGGFGGLMGKILGMLGLGGIFAGLARFGSAMIPAAIIIWGLISVYKVIQKWVKGFKADGFAGGFASAFGNKAEGGAMSALGGAATWAGVGAMAGIGFGPLGMLVGALIGAAIGGFFGWLGSDKIKASLDKLAESFDMDKAMTEEEKKAATEKLAAAKKRITAITKPGGEMDALNDVITQYEALKAAGTVMTETQTENYEAALAAKSKLQKDLEVQYQIIADLELQITREQYKVAKDERKRLQGKLDQLYGGEWEWNWWVMGWVKVSDMKKRAEKIAELKEELAALDSTKDAQEIIDIQGRITNLQDLQATQKAKEALYLQQIADAREAEYQELKKLYDDGNTNLMQDIKYHWKTSMRWMDNAGPHFMNRVWKPFSGWLKDVYRKVGNFIWEPGQETGPPGTGALTPAKLFGVELKWPTWMLTAGETFLSRVWNPFTGWLAELPRKIGNWIFTPKSTHPDHPSPAILFGVKLEWPNWLTRAGETFLSRVWNPFIKWLGELPEKITKWLFTPKGTDPDHPSPAILFGVKLEWPEWMKKAGSKMSDGWNKAMAWLAALPTKIGAWIYTGQTVKVGGGGQDVVVTRAKIFGVQLSPLPGIGDAISDAWNKLIGWAKGIGLWFWNEPEGTMFGNFKIPTLDLPNIVLPNFGEMFKKYIYDPGSTGGEAGTGTPMKIFGVALEFPKLNWSKDDIWNALPMWIRNPVQFIKDNLPDFGKAAEKVTNLLPFGDDNEDIVKKREQIQKKRAGIDVLEKKLGGMTKGTEEYKTLQTKINVQATEESKLGYELDDLKAASTLEKQLLEQQQRLEDGTAHPSEVVPRDSEGLHSKVGIYSANMGGVDWAKLGGRDTIEGIILSIWNDLGIKNPPTFTSGIRPKGHPLYRKGSQHSIGAAFDLRSKDISPALVGEAWSRLKSEFNALGLWGQWETGDVNKEGRTGEHFHFQLKKVADAIGNSEPHMVTDIGMMLKANPSAMGALLRGYGGGGGGGITTVNNVTVAPQTSTSVASTNISENRYGTVDPYTNAVGAYG